MPSPIKLIVGLANPGKEYAETRHNAGAWFVEDISQAHEAKLRVEAKFHGLCAAVKINHHALHLLIPLTFMNHSGQAVSACMRYLKITPDAILIAHDDIDLPVGSVKLKFAGGDGGHNGLKDIFRHLNTKDFYRLRIGVGRPSQSKDVVDYVLNNPSKSERTSINDGLQNAQTVLPLLLEGEMQKAMQQLHTLEN